MAKRRRSVFDFARCGCFGGQVREKSAEDACPVKMHIYDLSQGVARQLSTTIPGKAIQAIWHTGVVVYGKEYYFGKGIQEDQPGKTPYGTPVRIEDFGITHVAKEVFEGFLQDISQRYTPATYNLLSNNCNNFSNEAVQFLVGSTVPSYILDMPSKAMNSPIGALILPMIQGLETTLRAGVAPQHPQFRPVPAAETQKELSLDSIQVQPRSVSTDKTSTDKSTDDGRWIIPPTVQPAPAATMQTQPSSNSIQVRLRSIPTDEMSIDKIANDGSGIITPKAQPAPAPTMQTKASSNGIQIHSRSFTADEMDTDNTADDDSGITTPTAAPTMQTQASSNDIQIHSRSIPVDGMDTDKIADGGSGIIPPILQPDPAPTMQTQTSLNSIQVHSGSIRDDEMSTDKSAGDQRRIIPPTVQPVSAAATQTQPFSNSIHCQQRSTDADKTCADETAYNGSRIIPPTAKPALAAAPQSQPSSVNIHMQPSSIDTDRTCADKTMGDDSGVIAPPAPQPAAPGAVQVSAQATASPDPLREAKNRAQEEIKREFAAIMATGTMQAGEAAALAVRRIMAQYGLQRATASVQRR